MLTPPYLEPGDAVAIIAPAKRISEEEVNDARKIIKSWGFKVKYGKHLFNSENQFAGSDFHRLADFQNALDDPGIRAIICARGGYGSVRIIDSIDFSFFAKHPKWIAGFSDITVFHSHINKNYGVETIHSAMPVNFGKGNSNRASQMSTESLKNVLTGKSLGYDLTAHPLNRTGKASGILTGGNLSIIHNLAGTVSDIDTPGKILFIEDVDEYLYHIDRMMMNLKRSGKLKTLSGLIVGGMNDIHDNEVPFGKTACEIIADAVKDYDYPVIYNFPAGHQPDNCAMIMGRKIAVDVGDHNVSVSFPEWTQP